MNCEPANAQQQMTAGIDTTIFYHISYVGGVSGPHQHTLCWYTQNEVPNTHYVIEHFCWNRWVKKSKVTSLGKSGKHEYTCKVAPHSGANSMRVVLLNDSNIRLAVSKTLEWEAVRIPKVNYMIKKKNKEIIFTSETCYEIYDAKENLIEKDYAKLISYAKLTEGTYTLNYDNSTTTFKQE